MAHQITVTLPDRVYEELRRRAKAQRKALRKVAEEALCATAQPEETGSPSWPAELQALADKSDAELWRIAESRWPPSQEREWRRLIAKRDEGELAETEERELENLLADMQHFMVLQSEAWGILQQRGHRIPTLPELEQRARAKGWLQ
jgi:hypothetical protein